MSLKKSISVVAMLLLLASCTNKKAQIQENNTNNGQLVGNDRDEHGCIGSAGYQWSVLKNACIRIFETGIRLDPKDPSLDASVSAFVVFKSDTDDAQAEIFLPSQANSFMLNRVKGENAGIWKNASYTLAQWRGMYTLSNAQNKTLYEGMAVK